MLSQSPMRDAVAQSLQQFCEEGIAPDLALARPRAQDGDDFALFSEPLEARGWRPLVGCASRWNEVSIDDVTVLLAACRYRSLAYGMTRGGPAGHLSAARALVAALGARSARLSSGLFRVVSPSDLSLPRRGYSYGTYLGVSTATFEESAWLVGETHAALLVWTDED